MSVNIKYKDTQIASITETATRTLKTSGKYCEGDIVIENTKDSGGGGEIFASSAKGWIPEYQVGHAISELTMDTNMFTTSATGSLTE